MEPEVAFGIVLRGMRKKCGLSQELLAHEAGLERNYISLLELGRNSASIKTIFKLASVFKVAPSEMFEQVESVMSQSKR